MIDWLKNNKAGVALVALAIGLFITLIAIQGCSVYDVVKMKTSPKMQQVTGTAPVIPVGDYPGIRQEFVEATAKELQKNDAEYTDRMFWADLFASGVGMGLEVGEGYANTLPGGAALSMLIAGVGGLFLRKPGDGTEIKNRDEQIRELRDEMARQAIEALEKLKNEKIASFNRGLDEGKGASS